jgi:hypothetical protein
MTKEYQTDYNHRHPYGALNYHCTTWILTIAGLKQEERTSRAIAAARDSSKGR